jgi:tetratricopeptide (TPR) repeat protein
MPDPYGSTRPLDHGERTELAEFLALATSCSCKVVITSRTREAWLGEASHIRVAGLSPEETDQYCDVLVESDPRVATRRRDPAFADLLAYLGGHPMSMRLIFPHLVTTDALGILAALQDDQAVLLGEEGGDRSNSLASSLSYSYRQFSIEQQYLFVGACLFQGVVDVDVLVLVSLSEEAPPRFAGVGHDLWTELLDDAVELGLLTALGMGMYSMHPALPSYLVEQWRVQSPEQYIAERQSAQHIVIEAHAVIANWLTEQLGDGDAERAIEVVHVEQQCLSAALGFAVTSGNYGPAFPILLLLSRHWDLAGLEGEERGWTDRIRRAIEKGGDTMPDLDTEAGALWLLAVNNQAESDMTFHRFEAAEEAYRRIGDAVARLPESPRRRHILAMQYNALGVLAMRRGDVSAAEEWFRRSADEDESGTGSMAGANHHHLGMAAQRRGELAEADRHYQIAADIEEAKGDRSSAAATYHQRGVVAQMQEEFDSAERFYQKSLEILEELDDRPRMAISYGGLGVVELLRGRPDVAEQWLLRSLTLHEQFENLPQLAILYQHLGMAADAAHGDIDSADDWYERSLALAEQIGDRTTVATSSLRLGIHTYWRLDRVGALRLIVRCISQFPRFPHPVTEDALVHLHIIEAQLGGESLNDAWREVVGTDVPADVVDALRAFRNQR